jgi:hypothetical protein
LRLRGVRSLVPIPTRIQKEFGVKKTELTSIFPKVSISKTFTQAFTAIVLAGYGDNENFTVEDLPDLRNAKRRDGPRDRHTVHVRYRL